MTQFEARYEAGTLSASQQALRVLKPTVLAVAMGCVGSAWAADGGVVVNGTGRIATQGATTTVTQSTDKMVVNWNNFDIAQGQTVNFAQPSASSAVLNRVVGPVKATDIQGTLNANGRVYVVNPAGVMFGQNAVVNADSVVASTLNVDANQFMAGGRIAGNQKVLDLSAGNTKGSVVNEDRARGIDRTAVPRRRIPRACDAAAADDRGRRRALRDRARPHRAHRSQQRIRCRDRSHRTHPARQ